jgi:multicomponent Na+:H+ antiporter subunit D
MVIAAAMEGGYFWTWLVLLFASAGVFHHAGIKIPYFAFFAHDSGKRCKEAPGHMLVAMGITAALCVGIGSFPGVLYSILPFQADFRPYSLDHVAGQLQLLFLSALAFTILIRTGIYPPELRSTNLDSDWFYRRLGREAALAIAHRIELAWQIVIATASRGMGNAFAAIERYHAFGGLLAGVWPTGTMAFWTTALIAAYLIFGYLR